MRFFILLFFLSLISPSGFAEVTLEHRRYMQQFLHDIKDWYPAAADGHLSNAEVKAHLTNCRYRSSRLDEWLPEFSDRPKCSVVIIRMLAEGISYQQIQSVIAGLRHYTEAQERRIERPAVF